MKWRARRGVYKIHFFEFLDVGGVFNPDRRIDSRWHVQIDGAHRGDISEIMNNADKQSNVGVAE